LQLPSVDSAEQASYAKHVSNGIPPVYFSQAKVGNASPP
jgi:hypothetical protein